MSERRRHPRITAALAASVFDGDEELGDYLVQNLSEGGALLVHGPTIAEGRQLRMVLRGPGANQLPVNGIVLRLQSSFDGEPSVAVGFHEVGPRLREFIQTAILAASQGQAEPSVLVVHHSPIFLASIAMDLAALGHRSVFAVKRFEIVRCLQDPARPIQAVVMELSDDFAYAIEVFDFLRDKFCDVLRIAACKDVGTIAFAESFGRVPAQVVIGVPPTQRALSAALDSQAAAARAKGPAHLSDGPMTWPVTSSTRPATASAFGAGTAG